MKNKKYKMKKKQKNLDHFKYNNILVGSSIYCFHLFGNQATIACKLVCRSSSD